MAFEVITLAGIFLCIGLNLGIWVRVRNIEKQLGIGKKKVQ